MTEAASCRNVHMRHSENSPKLPDMDKKICERSVGFLHVYFIQGLARTQTPTLINCVPELPTFGVIAGVSPTEVQWKGLLLEEPPGWSRYPLYQVSMLQDWKAKLLPKLIFKYIWCFFIGESYDFLLLPAPKHFIWASVLEITYSQFFSGHCTHSHITDFKSRGSNYKLK